MVNVVEIVVRATDLTKEGFASASASSAGFSAKMTKLGMTGAAALGGIAVASIDMAAKFDSSMTMLQTQAGVSKQTMQQLSAGVLNLAGQVGFSPDSLAEAAYHVASNMASMGATSTQMLNAVKVAAEGAAVGHANLVDVTNALGAAIASGMKGTQNYTQAMGVLNATVGAGDMKMQDLADAFGSGLLATVKGFGVSITDVGAALAVFGDNNIRGAAAGTELRMAIQSLASPAKAGAKTLEGIGLSTKQLALDMQHGGLNQAITDLRDHMIKAGDTGSKVGTVLTDAFGKKAGAGINILVDQYGRLESKYPELTKGANTFGAAVALNNQTLSQKMKETQANFEALAIALGNRLMPAVQATFGYLAAHSATVTKVAAGILALTAAMAVYAIVSKAVAVSTVIVTTAMKAWAVATDFEVIALKAMYAWDAIITVATKAWAVAQAALDVVMDASPFILIGLAIAALVALVIKYHVQILAFIERTWDEVSKYVSRVWDDIYQTGSRIWNAIYSDTIGAVIRTFDDIKKVITGGFDSWWVSHGQELEEVWHAVWTAVSAVFKAAWSVISTAAQAEWSAFSTVATAAWHVLQAAWQALWLVMSTEFKAAWSVISGAAQVYWSAMTTLFKGAWAVIQGVWSAALAVLEGSAKTAWDVIAAAVRVAWAAIEAVFKVAWDVIVGAFSVFLDLITGHWSTALTDLKNTGTQVWNAIKGFLSTTWNAISALAGQVFNNMKNVIDGVWNAIKSSATSVWNALKSGFSSTVNAIGTTWNRLEGIFKTPVNFLISTVYDNGIRRFWNDVVGAVGLGALDLPNVATLAGGGRLPGFGGGDRNLALLEDGEAVIDKHRTARYAPLLKAMGVPGFASGGIFGGLAAGAKMATAAATGNPTAFANAFATMLPSGSGGAAGELATVIAHAPGALVTDLVKGTWSKLANGYKVTEASLLATANAQANGNEPSGPGGGAPAANAALARRLYPAWGSGPFWSAWNSVAMAESGWNQFATNPSSGAYGIPQALPFNKMPRAAWPASAGGSSNPTAQIGWMHDYIASVYGNPVNAWNHELSNHWYSNGGATSAGWATVGERGRELVKLPGGANVYPAGATAQMAAGGTQAPALVQLEVSSGGQSAFEQFMLEAIRNWVRIKGGGNVQTAFGRNR